MANKRTTNSRRRQSRQKKQKAMTDALKLIMALALIAVAVMVVLFVRGEMGGGLGFLSGSSGSSESETIDAEAESDLSEAEEPVSPGFNRDEEGRLYYLDEEGERSSDLWISRDGSLYYIDENGFVQTGELSYEGMLFTFSEEGEVSSIQYDQSYRPSEETEGYYSLVRTPRVLVYLDQEQRLGSFYLIRYRRTTEDTAYDLGGGSKQYTSPYSMQIDGDKVYYLPYTDTEESEDSYTNKNLYRMELGASVRELVAEDVEGYRVVDGEIYYQSKGRLHVTNRAGVDTTVPDFSQVEDFRLDISSGDRAYLYTADGRAVTLQQEAFKAGNFTYELAADGEILSVAEKTTVNTGGYTYSIEGDDAFGRAISRVARTDSEGKKEIISSEFDGSCGNLHYDFETGSMLAEYTDTSGKSRILRITKDGDVDYLIDDGGGDGRLLLYGIQDSSVICKKLSEAGDSFVELRIRASVPLALAVEPMELTEGGDVIDIGGGSQSGSQAQDIEVIGSGNGSSGGVQSIDGPPSESGGGASVEGPGAGLSGPGQAPTETLDVLGPGGAIAGGAPPG